MTNRSIDNPERPDIEIADDYFGALAVLRASPHATLRQVNCCVIEGRAVLTGTVPSFYLKQLAQSLVMRQLGNESRVDNQLGVGSPINESW